MKKGVKSNYKFLILSFLLVSFILLSVNFAFAQEVEGIFKGTVVNGPKGPAEDITNFFTGAVDVIKLNGRPIFGTLFGNTSGGGESLIVQILAFILVMLVVYGVLGTVQIFGDKEWINLAIGAIVAIIGIRFLPDGFLEAAAIPSSAFVGAMVIGIPFVLVFFIISKIKGEYFRRALWAGYSAIVFILWLYAWSELGWKSWLWIYPAIIAACGLAFWFDGTLQKFWNKSSFQRTAEDINFTEIQVATTKLADLQSNLKNQNPGTKNYQT